MIYILLKQVLQAGCPVLVQGSRGGSLDGGVGFQSDLTLDQFSGEASAHPEEQDLQREWQDPSPEAAFEI